MPADHPLRARAAKARKRVRRLLGRLGRRVGLLPPLPEPAVKVLGGIVEQFKSDRVSGWVAVHPDAPPVRVSLHLNAAQIATTYATVMPDDPRVGGARPFRFWLHDLWDYVTPADELVVRVGDEALPIHAQGMFLRPEHIGARASDGLVQLIAQGHIFGQKGRLQLSKTLDVEWQVQVLDLFSRVRALLAKWYGYDAFFIYGTLLGAVREGGFIGHDIDFDSAYVSALTDGPAAAAELRDIAFRLVDEGYSVQSFLTHVHIVDDAGTRIDLFHLYFDATGKLSFPFGIAGNGSITKNEWAGTTEIDFVVGKAVVPVLAERTAAHIYGASWRQPKPGFMWYLDRTDRAPEGIMPEDMVIEIDWADFYGRHGFIAPSAFCEWLLDRSDLPRLVADLGCGDGRDTAAFAASGRQVLALDRCPQALSRVSARVEAAGLAERVLVQSGDIGAVTALARHLDGAREAGAPMLFHLRFVLHAVTADVRERLLTAVDSVARPGDLVAVEFRTAADEQLPKAHERRLRSYLDADGVVTELAQRYRFQVVERQEGTGLSPYRDEDPQLARILAQRIG